MSAPAHTPQPAGPQARAARQRRAAVPMLIGLSGWAVLGVTALAGPGAIRSLAVFGFALAVPGLAIVRLLPIRGLLARAVLGVALSMSLSALVAEAAAIAHHLQPAIVLIVLATICTAAAIAELLQRE